MCLFLNNINLLLCLIILPIPGNFKFGVVQDTIIQIHLRLSFWIKRGYDFKKAEKRFLDHIRVLSFLIKRGYDFKKAERRFVDHIRLLSLWIKRGYDC